jgi:hypothetical protein
MIAVQALSAGVNMVGFMRTLTLLTQAQKAITATTDPREVAAFNRALDKVQKQMIDGTKAITKATEEKNKAEQEGRDAASGDGFNLFKELQNNITAINNQRKAFVEMRKAGIEASVASELAGNPEMAKALVSAAKAGGDAWARATEKIKEYTEAQKLLERTLIASAQSGDYELARLNMAQKYVDLQEHLIDMQNSVEMESYNDRLEEQSILLSNINREIEKITESSITPLERQIRANNYALEEIAAQEDIINEKYDKQFDALDKIKTINQDINKIQQQRISIADALTQGDISQAAQLIVQARQDRASAYDDSVRQNLEQERKLRLESLGREAIEKRNKQLQLNITRIKRDQIDALEDEKNAIQSNINAIEFQRDVLERSINQQKESLLVFGMTKIQIDNTVKALDLAKNAGIDINDKNFLNNVLKGATGQSIALSAALTQVAKDAKTALDDLQKLREQQISGETKTLTQQGDLTPGIESQNEDASVSGVTAINKDVTINPPAITKDDLVEAFGMSVLLDKELMNLLGLDSPVQTPKTISGSGAGSIYVPTYDSVSAFAAGGKIMPKYFAKGAFAKGTDTIPAMLTPGEFVVRKNAVDNFGVNNLNKINDGSYDGQAVYNYNLSVNVKSDANPNEIARTVMSQIKQIDSQRIRNQR